MILSQLTDFRICLRIQLPISVALMFVWIMVGAGCSSSRSTEVHGIVVPAAYMEVEENAELQLTLREDALQYLLTMAQDDYAGFRANALEALSIEEGIGEDAAREALLDENEGVRFAGAMIIGMNEFRDSAPLVHALLKDESESVQIAAIFALARNGYDANVSALAEFLWSRNLTVRSNAALAIGELGEPSAIEMLRDALEYVNPRATVSQQRLSDLQVAEAMAKLGDDTALSRIRAHLRASTDEGEVAALAASMLGKLDARVYQRDLVNIVAAWKEYRYPAEVRLAAMASLIRMGEAVPVTMPLEYFSDTYVDTVPAEFLPIRVQAVFVLGLIGTEATLPYLTKFFYESAEDPVRLQAAAAIIRIVEPVSDS